MGDETNDKLKKANSYLSLLKQGVVMLVAVFAMMVTINDWRNEIERQIKSNQENNRYTLLILKDLYDKAYPNSWEGRRIDRKLQETDND